MNVNGAIDSGTYTQVGPVDASLPSPPVQSLFTHSKTTMLNLESWIRQAHTVYLSYPILLQNPGSIYPTTLPQ